MNSIVRTFKRFADVISGRRSHWSKTNDAVIGEMWNRIRDLEYPNDTIFKYLLVAADTVVEELMNMGETTQAIIKIDCRKIDIGKFHELYLILLTYFSFLLLFVNKKVRTTPKLRESIRKSVDQITNRPDVTGRILGQLSIYHSKSLNEVYMGQVADRIWQGIAEIAGLKGATMDLERHVYFRMLLEKSCIDALKAVRTELSNTGPK